MNYKFSLFLVSIIFFSCQPKDHVKNFYPVEELKEDFIELREILEEEHPSLYLYETRKQKNKYFDSVFGLIDKEMTEIEFIRFISPVIAEVIRPSTAEPPKPAVD